MGYNGPDTITDNANPLKLFRLSRSEVTSDTQEIKTIIMYCLYKHRSQVRTYTNLEEFTVLRLT